MQLAMRDLEIRGAGNILGTEQSGQVSAVGFHLYCKMLKRTIEALQGKLPHGFIDTKVELPIDARLPGEYVNEAVLRMELYQRLGEAMTWEEVDALWRELKDRFGPPPMEAKHLFHLTRIRVYAARKGVSLLKWEKGFLTIEQKQGKSLEKKQVRFSLPQKILELEQKLLKVLGKN
jgi:transcription-repair coupling factor (superfamily II helicase)